MPLLALILIAGIIGGSTLPFDNQAVAHAGLWRIGHPEPAGLLILVTHLGGSFVLVPLALIVAGWLWLSGARRDALLLLATTMSGRAMVEFLKLLIDRPRPSLDPYPVYVSSQSFPSGHAGNSMVTYLALALFALPERWRPQGLAAALALALAIGTTRPVLGVHWPTDVIGGWAFGILWVLLWASVSRRPESA
jgi:undecaprenyl-diphosphatase